MASAPAMAAEAYAGSTKSSTVKARTAPTMHRIKTRPVNGATLGDPIREVRVTVCSV
jgi:hypothetical protein